MKQRREITPDRVDALVQERTGIDASRRLRSDRERLIDLAMTRAGVRDETAYLALLQRDQKAFDDLISELTVPESYFFRDPPNFEMLRREVLPAILAVRKPTHVLELWSAGCAGGEEAYSLAILLEQEGLAWRGRVLASDISIKALTRAAAGQYSRWALRAASESDVARYFEPVGKQYRLTERIRERVRFQKHSLSTTPYPMTESGEGFDLVLCRNVMIYFDQATVALAGQQLAQSVAEGGWLMTGPSDPLLQVDEWCDAVPTPIGMLYRRRGASEQRKTRSRPAPSVLPPRAPSWAPVRDAATLEPVPPPLTSSRPPPPPPTPAVDPPPALERDLALLAPLRARLASHGAAAAETRCREELGRHPLAPALHFLHAELLVDLGRDVEAETALRRALYLDPSLLPARMLAAALCERRGEHAVAARAYVQLGALCKAQPADAPVPFADGLSYAALGDLAARRAAALGAMEASGTFTRERRADAQGSAARTRKWEGGR